MAIPRVIHQRWNTREIPQKYLAWQATVRQLHPEWDYRLWTDDDDLRLVEERYPHALDRYRSLPRDIMRYDFARYLYLHAFGGLYLDLDFEMLLPFDLLDYGAVLMMRRTAAEGDARDEFGNFILAGEPRHLFFEDLIAHIVEHEPTIDCDHDVHYATGGYLLTEIYYANPGRYSRVLTPTRSLFRVLKEDRDAVRRTRGAYGIHHCDCSWRTDLGPGQVAAETAGADR